jgi:hypothetical protein
MSGVIAGVSQRVGMIPEINVREPGRPRFLPEATRTTGRSCKERNRPLQAVLLPFLTPTEHRGLCWAREEAVWARAMREASSRRSWSPCDTLVIPVRCLMFLCALYAIVLRRV